MPRLSQSFALTAAAVAVCCGGTATRAQDAPPTAVIVVDGSGSMWGNLGTDKRPKLEMVREALRGAAAEPAHRRAHRPRLVRTSPPRQLR